MAKRKVDRIARVVAEVEKVAKALRADVRKGEGAAAAEGAAECSRAAAEACGEGCR